MKKILAAIVLIIGFLVFWNWNTLFRLYKLANLTNPNHIVDNFLNTEKYLDVNIITKSPNPMAFPKKDISYQLPKTFRSRDSILNTQEFLDHTFSTGMLVLKDGNIIMEKYWRGMEESTTSFSFSIAKSFTSALVGFAIQDGLIQNENDPVTKYLPYLKNTAYKNATIKNLLEMTSGIRFNEDYADSNSDIDRFMQHFALGRSIEDFLLTIKESERKSGTFNKYNSMDAQVAGCVVKTALGGRSLSSYLEEKVWHPLGMEHDAQWAVDGEGMELTLGGLNVSLRDYAKFGQFYLQRGYWNGEYVLSDEWVQTSTTPHAPYLLPGRQNRLSNYPFGYGYFWWIPIEPLGGDFFASGIYNQFIYVNPQAKLVIAKTTANPHFKENPLQWKEDYVNLFQTIALQFEN